MLLMPMPSYLPAGHTAVLAMCSLSKGVAGVEIGLCLLLGAESLTTEADGLVVAVCWEAQMSKTAGLAPAIGWGHQGPRLILVLSGSLFILSLVASWFPKGCCSSRHHVFLQDSKKQEKRRLWPCLCLLSGKPKILQKPGDFCFCRVALPLQGHVFSWVKRWFSANKAEGRVGFWMDC